MSRIVPSFELRYTDLNDILVPVDVIGLDKPSMQRISVLIRSSTPVDVEAGRYVVRAYLPSGESISRNVLVHEGEDAPVALTHSQRSPRETLAWAYALHRPARHRLLSTRHNEAFQQDKSSLRAWVRPWNMEQATTWEARAQLPGQSIELDIPAEGPPILAELQSSPGEASWWLQVGGEKCPWKFIALPSLSAVKTLIVEDEKVGQDEDPLNVLVNGSNQRSQALLRYMHEGEFDLARRVSAQLVEEARTLMQSKFQDPYAAVIAGYFLLRTGTIARVGDWPKNLSRSFAWIPDGAVIEGWRLLRLPTPDRAGARQQFLEAARRGVPMYAAGVRLLLDGLDMLRRSAKPGNAEDSELTRACEWAAAYTTACDSGSAVTAFYAEVPTRPSPKFQFGMPGRDDGPAVLLGGAQRTKPVPVGQSR